MHNLYLNQRRGLLPVQSLDEQTLAALAGDDGSSSCNKPPWPMRSTSRNSAARWR